MKSLVTYVKFVWNEMHIKIVQRRVVDEKYIPTVPKQLMSNWQPKMTSLIAGTIISVMEITGISIFHKK